MKPALSIIIVNYNSAALVTDCIGTVITYTPNLNYEIIIVDNSASETDRAAVCGHYPQVRWIDMKYNSGFSRANNEGMRQAEGDVLLIMNPDILLTSGAIEQCYQQFVKSNYAACGIQLLNADGSPQISGNYAMKGGLNYLLPLPYVGALVKGMAGLAKVNKPNVPNATDTIEVDWINGAYIMTKREVVDQAGMFDEDFFLYSEEPEWCSRLRRFGKLCIYGQYTIIHLQGEVANDTFNSSGKGYYNLYDRKGLQIMLSCMVRIRKEFGAVWFLFLLCAYTATIPVFLLVGFFHRLFTLRNPVGHVKLWAGFTKNVGIVWGYLFTILRNKPHFYKVL